MKANGCRNWIVFGGALLLAACAFGAEVPGPAEVSRRLSERFLKDRPDRYACRNQESGEPFDYGGGKYCHYSTCSLWVNALECARLTGNASLEKRLCDQIKLLPLDRTDCWHDIRHVDFEITGAVPLEIAILTGDRKLGELGLAFATRQWDEPKPTDDTRKGNVTFEERRTWWKQGYSSETRLWIDDMYMITFLQLQANRYRPDPRYVQRAAKEMALYVDRLPGTGGLFHHAPKAPFAWARGNGWMAAAMPMLLREMTGDEPDYAKIRARYLQMMAALLKWQRPSGLWGQLVDDPESWDETSGSAMFAYAFSEGVKLGLLGPDYAAARDRAYAALVARLDANADLSDICIGTGARDNREWYMKRGKMIGDPHGQAPLLWLCRSLLENATMKTARGGERQALWPEGKMPDCQPQQRAAMTDEPITNAAWCARHRMPYLEWYEKPAKPNGGCMILVSGGGYYELCCHRLVRTWRDRFTALGYQTVNLVYRTPRPEGLPLYQSGWEDGQRGVRLVRAAAKARGYDPEKIGAIGLSAGGHLVLMLATSALTPSYARVDATDDVPCHVNWAIANAPAHATPNAKGQSVPLWDGSFPPETKLTPEFAFDAKTCPISFHHGGQDVCATPYGSTLAYRELRKRKIPAELHLYGDLGHAAHGLERAIEFMNQMNFVGTLQPEVELMTRYPNDDARAEYVKENVWPAGRIPDVQTNQCVPYIEWHIPKKQTTKAIQIIYSGGGYNGGGPGSFEVAPMRRFLNERGVTVVTMKYRTPRPANLPKHVTAWQDLQRAIRIVKSEAPARGLDPSRVGIMGSSAGGHLTLMGAFSSTRRAYRRIDALDDIPCNVTWGIAIYPAYALTGGEDKYNEHGGNSDGEVPVPEFAFDVQTPPMCFIHGDADGWAAMNSVKCWERLRSMGVSCDLHTLAKRPHCFQRMAAPGTGSYTWMEQVWDFLSHKGFVR